MLILFIITIASRPWGTARGGPDEGAPLKIGYLEEGSDLTSERLAARALLQVLKEELLADKVVSAALGAQGYSIRDISLRACDGPADMLQRLGAGEFELAMATAVIYARQIRGAGSDRPVLYEPILQFERRGQGVMRHGVVFVGRGSELWGRSPSADEILTEIESSTLAVSNYYSGAGFIYPLIAIADRFNRMQPGEIKFCGSGAEVLQHVVSGLLNVGACDSRILESDGRLETPDGSKQLYQVLFNTDPLPTDPILLRGDLMPTDGAQALGRELKVALRTFFNTRTPRPVPGLKVQKADRRSYEHMAASLGFFDTISATAAEEEPRAAPGETAASAADPVVANPKPESTATPKSEAIETKPTPAQRSPTSTPAAASGPSSEQGTKPRVSARSTPTPRPPPAPGPPPPPRAVLPPPDDLEPPANRELP